MRNVSKWTEVPLPVDLMPKKRFSRWSIEEKQLRTEVANLRKTLEQLSGNGEIIAVSDLPGIVIDDEQAEKVGRGPTRRATNRTSVTVISTTATPPRGTKRSRLSACFRGMVGMKFAWRTRPGPIALPRCL